jgi:hypothetical protein
MCSLKLSTPKCCVAHNQSPEELRNARESNPELVKWQHCCLELFVLEWPSQDTWVRHVLWGCKWHKGLRCSNASSWWEICPRASDTLPLHTQCWVTSCASDSKHDISKLRKHSPSISTFNSHHHQSLPTLPQIKPAWEIYVINSTSPQFLTRQVFVTRTTPLERLNTYDWWMVVRCGQAVACVTEIHTAPLN